MESEERDNSPSAIMDRYRKANEQSIVTVNRTAFDSLRDIYYLLEQIRILSEELDACRNEINTIINGYHNS
jgi:hypothetical protein